MSDHYGLLSIPASVPSSDTDAVTDPLLGALGSFLRDVINADLGAAWAAAQLDPELVRLTLDVAVAMAAQRHPTVMQMDWKSLMQAADEELTDIRMGKRTLIFPRPHGANHGGAVVSGNTATADAPTQRFWDDMGDF